jgi:hypothetical protein
MITFSQFTSFYLPDLNILNEDLIPNDRGVLHEHLVGQELNRLFHYNKKHNYHMSEEAKQHHDKLAASIGRSKIKRI